VSCFQELGTQRLNDCVSVIANHVIEKCQESRRLAGTLLLQLITEDVITVDQFVDGLATHLLSSEIMPQLSVPLKYLRHGDIVVGLVCLIGYYQEITPG